ncbi:MAG TPA: metallopeptidase TldD-related protein [Paraburkholderia sp.]
MTGKLFARGAAGIDAHACFTLLADAIERMCRPGETVLSAFSAEQSDFIRFNAGKVRQSGRVEQARLTLRLVHGSRQAYSTFDLGGDAHADLSDVADALTILRESLLDAPDDPHLLFDTSSWTRSTRRDGRLPDPKALVELVARSTRGLDFVGFYAGGAVSRGFASTTGSRGWYEVENFNLSGSFYQPNGMAIKTTYSGDAWDDAVFADKVREAVARLPVLLRAPRMLKPGGYRAWLAPSALAELLKSTAWDGFSARAQASSTSPLYKLNTGAAAFDARVSLAESLELGIAPAFNDDGYLRASVPLISAGRGVGQLTSARSAREYGLEPNGALPQEMPTSLAMASGDLEQDDVLARLGTGLYIGNLWYVNFSDRMNCRLTGMTRFATFWVEDGEIVAPVDAMRFDDSLYGLLGERLEALGAQSDLALSDSTWGQRATGGLQLPGALVKSFELVL